MIRKLWLTLWVMIMAAVFSPAPGWAEVDPQVLRKLNGDWTNLDGETGRFIISFDVAGGLLKKGYLDPKNGEYKVLNVTKIKFTGAKGQVVNLVGVDDETDSAECEFKPDGQEVICRDGDEGLMHLKRYKNKAE